MQTIEFRCLNCGHLFTAIAATGDTSVNVQCPKCGNGTNIAPVDSAAYEASGVTAIPVDYLNQAEQGVIPEAAEPVAPLPAPVTEGDVSAVTTPVEETQTEETQTEETPAAS